MKNVLCISLLFVVSNGFAQADLTRADWFNDDRVIDRVPGVSVQKTYDNLLKDKTPSVVVVAVIDSGVDIEHEDLRGAIWVNVDEIPNNGIDDDNNGYVDDVNGWNFIGGPNGDVEYDNLEFTRIYKGYYDQFSKMTAGEVPSSQKKEYKKYLELEKQFNTRLEKAKEEFNEMSAIRDFYYTSERFFKELSQGAPITEEMLNAFEGKNELENAMKNFMLFALEHNLGADIEAIVEEAESAVLYAYNLNYDSRSIVKDNPNDLTETGYGNNNVFGPAAEHGTHVAGIIAAARGNNIGLDGIAPVVIMPLRAVPQGDERDKDIANAIRYAVDNGAKIINMSFGKSYSPNKPLVDAAVKYAEEKGVLMVHAAGNSSHNNDKANNFPNPVDEETRELCLTWIEVGASSADLDALAAPFTNYGRKSVDVFAPGVDIYSTVPEGSYKKLSGTSMAAPVVSGMAALIMAYFPELTAKDVRDIIINTYTDYGKFKTPMPGTNPDKPKMVRFKKLSRTGGVVNVYDAIKVAELYRASKAD